ncbi:hypothetical protein R6Q57_029819 [Mikania cordata]
MRRSYYSSCYLILIKQIELYKSIYIGLGDTTRVSLTELPEEEIDPCRKLANLRMKASQLQQGVAPFEEKHRRYFDFQGELVICLRKRRLLRNPSTIWYAIQDVCDEKEGLCDTLLKMKPIINLLKTTYFTKSYFKYL